MVGLHDPRPVVLPEITGPIYSVDVECVATGKQHHDRTLAQIGLIDGAGAPVLNLYVKPEQPVVSYLGPITGLSAALIAEHGIPAADALQQLRAALPQNAFLVGQNISKDVEWLGLREGVDFAGAIDLAALFRVWTAEGRYAYFSQDHTAAVWLRGTPFERAHGAAHDALSDASISMALFRAYCEAAGEPARLAQLQQATLSATRRPSFAMQHPVFEGVCQGQKRTCVCGGPFFS
jgi:RNA exonuclease 4